MNIINAKLRKTEGLHTVACTGATIASVQAQAGRVVAQADDIDAQGQLLIAPLVEPHIHLDATLTAGDPQWNMSGTLFEGIERWGSAKQASPMRTPSSAPIPPFACWPSTASSTCARTSM